MNETPIDRKRRLNLAAVYRYRERGGSELAERRAAYTRAYARRPEVRESHRLRVKGYRESPEFRAKELARLLAAQRTPEGSARHVAQVRKYKARRKAAFIERINRRWLLECFEGRCGICWEPITEAWGIDHIIPLARGGLHIYENVQPAHISCNNRKAARLAA